MKSLRIRPATRADAAALSRLISKLGYALDPDAVEVRIESCRPSSGTILVAEDMDIIVGFLSFHVIPLFHESGGLGRITAMSIEPTKQRMGIGRALLEKLDGVAADLGCGRIEVASGDHRANDAHQFYQACGYQPNSRRFQKMLTTAPGA